MTPSPEVEAAVGEGPSLEERAAALRATVNAPVEAAAELVRVEAQIAAQSQAELTVAAERRLLGIVRAMGSLAASSEQDDLRVLQLAQQYQKAMETLSERFNKMALLRHEAISITEGFGLTLPVLPSLRVPAQRPAVDEAREIIALAPVRDNGFIQEQREYDPKTTAFGPRSYGELAGTEGGVLLKRRSEQKQPVGA